MSRVTVRFACGHAPADVDTANDTPPVCTVCGERRIGRTFAPPPRFRGACQGPSAVTEMLDAMPVGDAAPKGPLMLKEPKNG